MKLDYYYDGQFHRELTHLIRLFSGFTVQNGVDDEGKPRYREVPVRYADISKMAAYIINSGSENIINSAPIMTISVESLNVDRKSTRSNADDISVFATNKTDDNGNYIHEIDKMYKVTRHNPVPYKFVFNLNIWTTQLQAKMELWEQICTLFAPSVQMQMSNNPLDWTSIENVELVDTTFSTRGVPQGNDTDLDIAVFKFETTIWFSLPARVEKPKLINQINTNMTTYIPEKDMNFDFEDPIVDVFTPKNLGIGTEEQTDNIFEITLISQSGSPKADTGGIYSWKKYFQYLDPDYEDKEITIRFQTAIEETNPLKGIVTSIGSGDDANKLTVEIDPLQYSTNFNIIKLVSKISELNNAIPEQYYVNNSKCSIQYKDTSIEPNMLFKITNTGADLIDPETVSNYIYNRDDTHYYKYNKRLGWYRSVKPKYTAGYWRITFRDKN
ncbi:hypothetical protein [Klebsiella phage phiKp_21]|nr:hypothetical protein [Klebsiella phage phiKp_21]